MIHIYKMWNPKADNPDETVIVEGKDPLSIHHTLLEHCKRNNRLDFYQHCRLTLPSNEKGIIHSNLEYASTDLQSGGV